MTHRKNAIVSGQHPAAPVHIGLLAACLLALCLLVCLLDQP